jgi:K+-transporting ATPase c subunit
LKFTEEYDSSVYGTKTINVDYTSDNYYNNYNNYSSSSSYNAKELSVYSISSTNPSTYQWVNVTLRALTNN